jgi:hypothetical protein
MSQFLWRCSAARLDPASEGELARDAVALAAETDNLTLHADALMALTEVQLAVGEAGVADETRLRALNLYERKGNVVAAERARALAIETVS